ncbi:MAG: hypothetical protein H6Q90_5259 [Deltaproteobacteria bacterium]|nr:hypothetical protein [Deltaproteobacteria bacterium]
MVRREPRYEVAMTKWLILALLAGCATDESGTADPADLLVIANQPAQGTIAGVSWTLGTRFMNVSVADNELNVDLLQDAVADCTKDETQASYPFIIFFTPATPGRYELGQTQFVTFVDKPSSNLIVSRGVVQIDAITATTVSAGLHVFDPEFGEINGRFDGQLCFSN